MKKKKKTASQLRLAADILETGHPWGFRLLNGSRKSYDSPIGVITDGNLLIPILATPPDGRRLHNPDHLTAEQVGVGYRLTLKGEPPHVDAERWSGEDCGWEGRGSFIGAFYNSMDTYRLPLSVPWPPAPVNPYAELKAAHAAGEVIQFNPGDSLGWRDHPIGDFTVGPEHYRIKPEPPQITEEQRKQGYEQYGFGPAITIADAPPFQLPPPPPGMRWHREDGWKAEDLPPGTRPLVEDEEIGEHDERGHITKKKWMTSENQDAGMASNCLYRTTRPLVFTHAGKSWTWHKAGDPMPCDGERKVHVFWVSDEKNDTSEIKDAAKNFNWSKDRPMEYLIIGWRYAEPETKTVELGPEDIIKNIKELLATLERQVQP